MAPFDQNPALLIMPKGIAVNGLWRRECSCRWMLCAVVSPGIPVVDSGLGGVTRPPRLCLPPFYGGIASRAEIRDARQITVDIV